MQKNSNGNSKGKNFTKKAVFLGALLCGLSVALGAFGAHALAESLSQRGREIWELAVRYGIWHGLAILACAILYLFQESRSLKWAVHAFGLGVFLFSGSLYLLAFWKLGKWALLTPIGGSLLLLGWLLLAIAALLGFQKPDAK